MSEPILDSARFRAERQPLLDELEVLVYRAENMSLAGLFAEERLRLLELYRFATATRCAAQSFSLDQSYLEYLNSLNARAFLALKAPALRSKQVLEELFFNNCFGLARPFALWVVLALFLGGIGFLIGLHDFRNNPNQVAIITGAWSSGLKRIPNAKELEKQIRSEELGKGFDFFEPFVDLVEGWRNGEQLIGGGLAGGVGAGSELTKLGAQLGVSAGATAQWGFEVEWWNACGGGFIPLYLFYSLSGAAGLAIGWSLIFPGRRSRLDALRETGIQSARLFAFGAVLSFLLSLVSVGLKWIVPAGPWRWIPVLGAAGLFLLPAFLSLRIGKGENRRKG